MPATPSIAQTAVDAAAVMSIDGGGAAATVAPATAPVTPAATAAATPAATAAVPGQPALAVPSPEAPKVAIDEPFKQSLFMSPEDLVAIERALKGVVTSGSGAGGSAAQQEIPQVRKITLSGVSYKAPNQWVVWINGQKIVPGLLLKEIVDIKVERDLVHLKWFDIGLNGVINITLRPHDTYDIVTGVLLPG